MHRYDRRVYILRVWLERDPTREGRRWRASLTDETDGPKPRYFTSPADLLQHLRERLRAWPQAHE